MFLFSESFLLVRNIVILQNNISTMLLWSVSYMPHWYITLNHNMALTAFSSGHSFVNKFLKEIYIYIFIFHFSTSQLHHVQNLLFLSIPISVVLFLLSLLLYKICI